MQKTLLTAAVGFCLSLTSWAGKIAVFGDNATDDFLTSLGHTVTLVSDAQLATPGFLNSFDLFYMTRDGSLSGTGLSAAAAANVYSWVQGGRFVLLNADFADGIGDPTIDLLTANAVNWVLAGGSRGFIGEFNGSVSALTANSQGWVPIGIVAGSAGPLGYLKGGSGTNLWVVQPWHPVMAGLPSSFDPQAVEFGSALTGVDPALVVAAFGADGPEYPGVIAGVAGAAPIPEPGTFTLLGVGLVTLVLARRRR